MFGWLISLQDNSVWARLADRFGMLGSLSFPLIHGYRRVSVTFVSVFWPSPTGLNITALGPPFPCVPRERNETVLWLIARVHRSRKNGIPHRQGTSVRATPPSDPAPFASTTIDFDLRLVYDRMYKFRYSVCHGDICGYKGPRFSFF